MQSAHHPMKPARLARRSRSAGWLGALGTCFVFGFGFQSPATALPLPQAVTATGAPAAPDAALLARVVEVLSTPQGRARAEAAARLAGLSDARSVQVLAYIARHDRDQAVALAATKGLGALGKEGRGEVVALLQALGSDGERETVAEAALDTLGELRTPAAFEGLRSVAGDDGVHRVLRKRAVSVARRAFPERIKELPRLSGDAALAATGGVLAGGYTLGMIGRFAATDSAEAIGWVTGGVLGGASGYLLGRELPNARQAYYASGLFWGAAVGGLLGRSLRKSPVAPTEPGYGKGPASVDWAAYDAAQTKYNDDVSAYDRFTGGLSVAGEVLVGLGAWAIADDLDLGLGDVLVADLGASSAFVLTFGALQQVTPKDDKRAGFGLMAASTSLGLALATWAAPKTSFTAGDAGLTTLATAEGATAGAALTGLLLKRQSDRSGEKIWGGTLMGTGLGLAAGGALAQFTAWEPGDVGQMLTWSLLGKALGSGSVLLTDPEDGDPPLIGMLLGGTAGLVAAATVARPLQYHSGDPQLVALATGWGLWHGFAVGGWLSDHGSFKGTRVGGLTLVAGGALGAGAVVASQYWDPTGLEVAMGGTGLVWGGWIAGWSGALADWRASDVVLATAIGGDVGAAVSSLLVSPVVGLDPMVLGGASLGGIGLAGVGTMAMMMVTDNRDRWIQANIAGSVLGLVGGGLITAHLLEGRARPRTGGAGAAESGEGPTWLRGLSAAPLTDREGRLEGFALTLQGVM